MKKNYALALVVFATCMFLSYQTNAQTKNLPPKPAWVEMMDDPSVNYFEAVRQFEQYWKNREKPVVENELFESAMDNGKKEAIERKKKRLNANDPARLYAFEYKKFLWWMREVEPFVQTDGHIQTMNERVKNWKMQEQLRNKKNKTDKE